MADRSGLAPMSNKAHISQPRCLTIRFPSSDPATLLLRTGVCCSVGVRDAAWTREPQVALSCAVPADVLLTRSLSSAPACCHKLQLQAPPAPWECNSKPHAVEGNGAAPRSPAEAAGLPVALHQPGAKGASHHQGLPEVPSQENKIQVHF